ncbi:MAG TPA: response regulator transcription factor [Sphaerochaeta sp.]|nr:response regulator transcription factor [Sphaerochaeta sp.]
MKSTHHFLIVDDHPLFSQGLASLISNVRGYTVVGEAVSISEALSIIEEHPVDIALVDISLREENGLDLVRTLKSSHPKIRSLIISMYDETIYANAALKAGARGYVMKQEAASSLLEAIEEVLAGKVYLSPEMQQRMLRSMVGEEDQTLDAVSLLSLRELEVLRLIGHGYGVSEIGEALHLSVKTINVYRDNIRHKLDIADAAELRRFAIKWARSQKI